MIWMLVALILCLAAGTAWGAHEERMRENHGRMFESSLDTAEGTLLDDTEDHQLGRPPHYCLDEDCPQRIAWDAGRGFR